MCWGLCRASIGKGEVRCQDCTKALLTHPLAAVRAMLASEVGTYGDDVLMALAHDPELSVSINAQSQLKKRTRAQSGVLHEIF